MGPVRPASYVCLRDNSRFRRVAERGRMMRAIRQVIKETAMTTATRIESPVYVGDVFHGSFGYDMTLTSSPRLKPGDSCRV